MTGPPGCLAAALPSRRASAGAAGRVCDRARGARSLRREGVLEAARPISPARSRGTAGRLGRAAEAEWPDAGTVVCRCEETRWSDIGAAVAGGARDVRAVREVTRCGTGYCQARVCGPALTYALSAT